MIEESARVVAVGDGIARVETMRRSACSSCAAASGCGTSTVSKLFPRRTNRIEVADGIGLGVGDRVIIGIEEGALTRASLLAYLLPLVALMLAAFGARSAGAGEDASALAGLLGLGLGLWVTGRLSGAAGPRALRPQLLRRSEPVDCALGSPPSPDRTPAPDPRPRGLPCPSGRQREVSEP